MSEITGNKFDVVVIGGGQAGLSLGFYLRRAKLSYVILDAQREPGGAWRHSWKSLRLFSPAQWSSLPGWLMPGGGGTDKYPTRDEVLSYIEQYEKRYALPVKRAVKVAAVKKNADGLIIEATDNIYYAKTVISATGSWEKPFVPVYPGQNKFTGIQIHSANYHSPESFAGKRVLVVGGGNSGAQIMAEVSLVSDATWVTLEELQFLPDDVDGRVLFDAASERYRSLTTAAAQSGSAQTAAPKSRDLLGSIVVVEPVKNARDAGRLKSRRPFERFTESGVVWTDGKEETVDAVIWATGFNPALDHLRPLGVVEENNRVAVAGTHSVKEPRLWLVGYGNWTGFASATLIGVGRTARRTVEEIGMLLN